MSEYQSYFQPQQVAQAEAQAKVRKPSTPEEAEQMAIEDWKRTQTPAAVAAFDRAEKALPVAQKAIKAGSSLYIALDGLVPSKESNRPPVTVFFHFNEHGIQELDVAAVRSLKARAESFLKTLDELLALDTEAKG